MRRKNETVDFMVVYHKSNKMILLIQTGRKAKIPAYARIF